MGKEEESSDQINHGHITFHHNRARSDTGGLVDDSGSQASSVSVKTDGALGAFRSDIPNMKLWRRFMNEQHDSQGRKRVPLMVNTWATRQESE